MLKSLLAEGVGVDSITMHLREDRRHVQDSDVERACEKISTRLNLEMACTSGMIEYALKLMPHSVCLVPENREEVTTEGGLDVAGQQERVRKVTEAMREVGILTSLFIDPDVEQIGPPQSLKAWVELHTGAYANAYYHDGRQRELESLVNLQNMLIA